MKARALLRGVVSVAGIAGLAGVMALGCREKPLPDVYLGVVDGGTYTPPNEYVPVDAGLDHHVPDTGIQAPSLSVTSCATTFSVAGDPGVSVGGITLIPGASAVLIGQVGSIATHALDSNECPVEDNATKTVDVGRVVGIQAFPGGITLVAGSTGVARISPSTTGPDGTVTALCAAPARGLAATSDDHAVVTTGLSSLQPVDFPTADTATCSAGTLTVDGSILSLTSSESDAAKGWIALVKSSPGQSATTQIRRIDLTSGQLDATPIIDAAGALCGADALLELGGRLYVVDGGCSRVVAFNVSSGAPLGVVSFSDGTIPRALAALPSGDLLLASARDNGGRSTVSFSRISP